MTEQTKTIVILGTAHGVNVPGKCSPDGKFREYRFSREIVARLKPMLEHAGVTVVVDLPEDEVPLPQSKELALRCRRVNDLCARYGKENCVYVSIHVNAAGRGEWKTARGYAVYVAKYSSMRSKYLARELYAEAERRGLSGNRSVPKEKFWQANFYVLKSTACPAVLTENLFQDNREDVAFLMSEAGKTAITELHYQAIIKYCAL